MAERRFTTEIGIASLTSSDNFGRKELPATADEIVDAVTYQLGVFQAIAEAAGVRPNHVKPHGALYNMAARDAKLADAVTRAIATVDPTLILFAPDGSELAGAGEAKQLRIAREVFADRNYLANGSLVSRARPDALLHDPEEAIPVGHRLVRHRVGVELGDDVLAEDVDDRRERDQLDDERCILCSRCIRFCQEIAKDDVLGFVDRGSHTVLTAHPGKRLENNYSLNTVDICPVGALTSTDFRFKMRVWFLKETKSICTSCATGCNTVIGTREDVIYRQTPR